MCSGDAMSASSTAVDELSPAVDESARADRRSPVGQVSVRTVKRVSRAAGGVVMAGTRAGKREYRARTGD
jgi:hypothetical protein